jgi:hypothetical protein
MELNPNHGVTQEVREQWYKIAALLLSRIPGGATTITVPEIEKLDGKAITVRFSDRDGIVLKLVTMEGGEMLAKKEGGLPH